MSDIKEIFGKPAAPPAITCADDDNSLCALVALDLQADDSLSGHGRSQSDSGADIISAVGESSCYNHPLDPVVIDENSLQAGVEGCFGESAQGMETSCDASDGAYPQNVVIAHQTLLSVKSKHRQRQGASPDSRSGSPYSSDSLSSSSFSDRWASTTAKDTYSNETNENSSSSFDVGSDKEKSSPWSMANFDRVVHDAPKREHIRSRKYTGSRTSQYDSGSSSSQSRIKPAARSKLHGRTVDMTMADLETSTSSGSMVTSQGKDNLEGKEGKSLMSNGTDTGIATANTSCQSVMNQSNFSMSSSLGIDTRHQSKEGKNLQGKSVGHHYHDIRIVGKNKEPIVDSNSSGDTQHPHHFRQCEEEQSCTSDPVRTVESERKRRRFNRTFVLLRHCGLLELTLQTASLMQQSSLMDEQLKSLRQQTVVLYNAINELSTSKSCPGSFDSTIANGILKNLRDIMNRHESAPQPAPQHTTRRMAVKRNSCGETVSPDSGNAQSSSALHNSGSST